MGRWKINHSQSPSDPGDRYLTVGFRLLGLFPLFLFLAHLEDLIAHGELGHILWMCHLSNLVLALGLFLAWPALVRVSVPWLTFGLPLWIWDMTQMGMGALTSFGTHVGGLTVGLFTLSRMGNDGRSWIYALIWYLIIQQVCRMITPIALNVNLAHTIYVGWEEMFTAYWQYWLVTTALAGLSLWAIDMALFKLFPPKTNVEEK